MTSSTHYVAGNVAHIKNRIEVAVAKFSDVKITGFSYDKFKDEISLSLQIRETTPRLFFSGRNYPSKDSLQADINYCLARLYYTRTAHPDEFKFTAFSSFAIVANLDEKLVTFPPNDPDLAKRVYDSATGILYVDRIQKALDPNNVKRSPLQCPFVIL